MWLGSIQAPRDVESSTLGRTPSIDQWTPDATRNVVVGLYLYVQYRANDKRAHASQVVDSPGATVRGYG